MKTTDCLPRARLWIRLVLPLALLALLCAACSRPRSDRPNVVLIVTDDQLADSLAFMPNVQRYLVDEGTLFSAAFTSTPLCCPARVSILRGQYAHNHEVLSNGGPAGGFPKLFETGYEDSTLATWLQGAGYRTAMIGKYLNAYPYGPEEDDPPGYRAPEETYIPPGWSEWYGFFDVPKDVHNTPYGMYNYKVNANGAVVRYGSRPEDYQTDVLAGLSSDFIARAASRGNPFFLYLAPTAPHLPAVPAERHKSAFPELRAPRPPSFNEADMLDKPRWLKNLPPLSAEEMEALDRIYREQAQMLLGVDEMVGTLIETLRDQEVLHNTFFIFTSDHGWHSGEHRLFKMKLTPYDASARIPLVIRGPGVPKGRETPHLALNTDLAPTIAALLGVPAPSFVDGRSLRPLLRAEPPPESAWRRGVLTEFWPRAALKDYGLEHLNVNVGVPQYGAVRTKDHLYVEYTYLDGRTEGELYDLKNDPFELHNLYREADPALLEAFAEQLRRLQACAGASCRVVEDRAFFPPDAAQSP